MKYIIYLWSFWVLHTYAQTTDLVVLRTEERARLIELIQTSGQVKHHYDSISQLGKQYLSDIPLPLTELFYEGMLDTHPKRIDTQKSLKDIDKVCTLIYTYYGDSQHVYALKAKEFVTAWSSTYIPTGNTINENKFVPLFWAYYLFEDTFDSSEKKEVRGWMINIAKAQMSRPHTPNNNWEAKRQKIIGTVGCIFDVEEMKEYAIEGLKAYIETAYYADGTSNDLKKRDALHYHNSGLKPIIGTFINCSIFDPRFDLFNYVSPSKSSIMQSVEYVIPYAKGEKTRKEWTNSQVELDKRRAAAGIEKYQPGKLFDPNDAIPLFEWASYYRPEWYILLGSGSVKQNYTSTWVGLLNSPLIRKNHY